MLNPYYKETQSVNIEPLRSYYVPFSASDAKSYDRENSSRFTTLNGMWRITAYDSILDVPDDFYNTDGKQLAQLTKGEFEVMEVLGFNEAKKSIIYASNEENPIQRNLYAVDMKGRRKLLPLKFRYRSFKHV